MSKENYRGIWVYIEQADHQARMWALNCCTRRVTLQILPARS